MFIQYLDILLKRTLGEIYRKRAERKAFELTKRAYLEPMVLYIPAYIQDETV